MLGQRWLVALVLACCLLLSSCQSLSYYAQAVQGQVSVWRQRQSIPTLLQDAQLEPTRRRQLALVQQVREFAADALALPVKQQFSTYVDLQRDFVVWNVVAAEEFSITPRTWCYPIAGCVGYRGYFSEAAAQRYAGQLRAGGLDVYVGGVSAYSTLGWFDDPVLSSMLQRDDTQLVSVIIHELAHSLLYAPGDTDFNESFATTVEQEGLRRWLAQRVSSSEQATLLQQAEDVRQRQQQFVDLVQAASQALGDLYQQGGTEAALRQQKQARLAQLKRDYQQLRASWGDYTGYDRWFAGELNNAQLSTVRTYHRYVPALQALLVKSDNDLARFYLAAKQLAELPMEERQRLLDQP
jgi:predicted aminopeptidase